MGATELLLVLAVGGGIIAVLYPTFRGAAREAEKADPGAPGSEGEEADVGERAELEERRRAVLRSLQEIEADREAGNLSEEDYESLRRRYEREATLLLARLDELEAEPASPGPRRAEASPRRADRSSWPRLVGWGAAVVGFAALAALVMTNALGPRSPDGTITGNTPSDGMSAGAGSTGGMSGGGALVPVDRDRLDELEEVVAADSSNVAALVELGHLYLATQRFQDVADLSMKALSLDPENPEALTHLGMVLVAVGHGAEGRTAFERALEIDPNFHEALLYKGIVAFQNQSFQEAVDAWERYLDVAPPDANVARVEGMLEGARQAAARGGE